MVSRYAWIKNLGLVDLLNSFSTSPTTPVVTDNFVIDSHLDDATVISPINREDMWRFTGSYYVDAQGVPRGYGSYSNFTNTSVVQTDGPGGVTTNVLDQFFPTNGNSNYAMPPTGTGIALTSMPLAGGAVEEATIEYDFRAKSDGTPWGWGGKLPGLGGLKPGASGGVPTGGQPSPNGFSCRMMFRRISSSNLSNPQAKLVSYFYSPDLPAGAIGNDIDTGKLLTKNKWHHIKQYHKMNTVTTEGSTTPPKDGIHRIWVDGVLAYESTSTVYRFYTDAKITHLVWDNFYGGNDVTDNAPWGPTADTHHQFDNLVVNTGTTIFVPIPAGDTTAPTVPSSLSSTNESTSGFTISWAPATDAVGVTLYEVQIDGSSYGTTASTSLNVTGRSAGTAYSVRVRARDAAANYSAYSSAYVVTTTSPPPAPTPQTLFSTQTPGVTNASDGSALTLATRFTSDVDGTITGVRFYKATTSPSAVIGLLYSDTGTELARATFGTLVDGWNSVSFATPVPISAGSYYRAAYWSASTYVATGGFFATPLVNGHLTATSGTYGYTVQPALGYDQFNNGCYFADPIFLMGVAAAPESPAAPNVSAANQGVVAMWSTPINNGGAITGYDLQTFVGNTPGPVISVGAVNVTTITGLTNGTAYTVKIRAKNSAGNSAYSAASVVVTPVASAGYPDASNTGVPSTVTLTPYTGSEQITTPGTVIDGKRITVGLVIKANDVTIKNCFIDIGQGYYWGVLNDGGYTGLQILDTEINGGVDSAASGAYTMRRCNIHNSTDGLKASTNTDIQDTYIHDMTITPEGHNDGIQCLGTTNLIIRHNRIVLGSGATAPIILSTGSASDMRNVTIDDNLLGGGVYSIYGGYQAGSDDVSKVTNIRIINNKFTTATWSTGGQTGPLTSIDPPVYVSGNVWYDGPLIGQMVGRND